MDFKGARRFSERTNVSVLKRNGGTNQLNNNNNNNNNNYVCKYWLAGRCTRNPCKFLHSDSVAPQPKLDNCRIQQLKMSWKNPNCNGPKNTLAGGKIDQVTMPKLHKKEVAIQKLHKSAVVGGEVSAIGNKTIGNGGEVFANGYKTIRNGDELSASGNKTIKIKGEVSASGNKTIGKAHQKLCKFWVTGSCGHVDKCVDHHSWFVGNGFSLLTRLEGHKMAVTGLALPHGSDKLYSGSKDSSVRVWDCNTGKCDNVVDLKAECGVLIGEGPWVFVGVPNNMKAWNFQSQLEHNLEGPVGQVHAIAVFNELLFAGTEDGTILVWRSSSGSTVEPVTSLKGHSRAILSLIVGANRLYSGSADCTIRIWDIESFKCLQTLKGHTKDVTSVICWDNFLISGSLDNKLKIWAASESGNLEIIHERIEDDGVISLCGITDAEAKPILLCSCKDNTVRLYDLPSFSERGRIFSKTEVQVVHIGTGGLFFTGDATGLISVWKLHGQPQ